MARIPSASSPERGVVVVVGVAVVVGSGVAWARVHRRPLRCFKNTRRERVRALKKKEKKNDDSKEEKLHFLHIHL